MNEHLPIPQGCLISTVYLDPLNFKIASVAQLVSTLSFGYAKVVHLIPGQGTNKNQPMAQPVLLSG